MLLLSFLRIFSERIAWKLNGMDWIKVNKHASTQTLFAHNNNKSIIRLCTTKPMYERAAATIIITKLSAVSWHCVEVADFHPNSQHTHIYVRVTVLDPQTTSHRSAGAVRTEQISNLYYAFWFWTFRNFK